MRLFEKARLAAGMKLNGAPISRLLRRPDFDLRTLPSDVLSLVPLSIWELLETDFKYEGYVARQSEQNQRLDRTRNQDIPDDLDYNQIAGLRLETRQKLSKLRPTTLGQAAHVSGITPADISILHIWINRNDLCSSHSNAGRLT